MCASLDKVWVSLRAQYGGQGGEQEINTKEEMRTIKINKGETECGDLVRLINASLGRLMADEST